MMDKSLICLLLAVVLLSVPVFSSSDGPFIVAHKKASLNRLKTGAERVSVSVDIYNQGSAYAFLLYILSCTKKFSNFSFYPLFNVGRLCSLLRACLICFYIGYIDISSYWDLLLEHSS